VGWKSFITICEQNANMHGKTVIKVPPAYTTQTCSECGAISDEKIHLGVEEWTCPHCGRHHLRDHNAAKNILYKGLCGTQQP
ncbi:MAG: transposase, partial [Mogibacterium sp.]|nr:transposase [Mogibacterium sp.]